MATIGLATSHGGGAVLHAAASHNSPAAQQSAADLTRAFPSQIYRIRVSLNCTMRPMRAAVDVRVRALLALALVLAVSGVSSAQSRTARTVRFASQTLGGEATFAILLPPDYDATTKRYPVVYLLHGGTQNHASYPSRSWFAKEVTSRGLIAVTPHVPQFAYTARGASGSIAVDTFIVRDLVAYVDAHYRTVVTRNARAIAGLSMGGFGAVTTGLSHPDMFGTVGAFSGAFSAGREAGLATAIAALSPDDAPYFFLACGLADTLLPAGRALVTALRDVWDPQTVAFLDVLRGRPGFTAVP
jgi:S-formylglutathione hydrolase FrmB